MKKFLFSIAALLILSSNPAFAAFNDVTQATWYKTAIDWMANNGVIQGYKDGTFKPDVCVNRAEFLKMLFVTHQTDLTFPEGTAGSHYYDSTFHDVDLNAWYWPYVRTALRNTVVKGYSDGTFKPGQCVNRVEAIKMAVVEFDGENFVNDAWAGSSILLASYKDADPQAWYYKYFTHVIFGDTVGQNHVRKVPNPQSDAGQDLYFDPGQSMSRKEVAEMLYRMKTIKDNNIERFSSDFKPKNLK